MRKPSLPWVIFFAGALIFTSSICCLLGDRMQRAAERNRELARSAPTAAATATATAPVEARAAPDADALSLAGELLTRGVTVPVRERGSYVDVDVEGCSPRTLARFVSAPPVLEALLRRGVRLAVCARSPGDEVRLPPAGVPVPPSIPWHRSYVATRFGAGSPADHPPMWCQSAYGAARCFRERAACVAAWDDGARDEPTARACHLRGRLVCFDTSGSERSCHLDRDACEAARERLGRSDGSCEDRWAL